MRLLITGGAGFIGSHVLRFLASTNPDYTIVCADALTYASNYDLIADLEELSNYTFEKVEITDINQHFLEIGHLSAIDLFKSDSWFDTGTIDSLYEATDYVRALESHVGVKVGCIEEAAFTSGFLSMEQVVARAEKLSNTSYGDYLNQIVQLHGG